jgi:hypothetical protein
VPPALTSTVSDQLRVPGAPRQQLVHPRSEAVRDARPAEAVVVVVASDDRLVNPTVAVPGGELGVPAQPTRRLPAAPRTLIRRTRSTMAFSAA